MTLLKKIDRRRLKENPESKDDYCVQECKHYGSLIKLLWEVKNTVKNLDVGGSSHAMHACRHLKKVCNEEGHFLFILCNAMN